MRHIPQEELSLRHARCRALLERFRPEAGGLMCFGRTNIYYLTGAMGAGVLWLPRTGRPLLMVRKGMERVALDNPDLSVASFHSYGDLRLTAQEHGVPLSPVIAAEKSALPWQLADTLQKKLAGISFVGAEGIFSRLRAIKSSWELEKMRIAGELHAKALEEILPARISPGMTELQVAHAASDIFYSLGNCGVSRMSAFGEEMLLGEVSAGASGNYPTFYNGPLGCRGIHPSAPFLGSADVVWKDGDLLTVDAGFCFEGYNSDKTQCYFAGDKSAVPLPARKAHALCRDMEAEVAQRMRPGVIPRELYALALRMAEEAGFAAGFMGLGGNKVPFLGHSIGLCIDEWPVLAAGFGEPLEAGMTLAVEPKIGLEGIGMVGVENTWEITEHGARCLSGRGGDIICVE